MDEHKQHNGQGHSGHGQKKEDHSQHNASSHAAHGAMDHSVHAMSDHSAHATHQGHVMPASTAKTHDDHSTHAGHGPDHTGHEQMFRVRFWWCLLLSIPVLLYSGMIQMWLGFTPPAFPFSEWIPFVFSVIIFAYGGVPFLQMAVPELQERKPGMMTLISLAISVAFIYSVAAQFMNLGEGFFWELVTLIDIMLLGHWLEMRSVRQASGALSELAKLMPDTAERIHHDDSTETVPVSALKKGDLLLVRPGASIPADGEVTEGHSNVNEAMITGESKPVHKMAGAKVIAGTINGDGSLRVRVTATGNETALAGIMRLVEQAQQSKSKTQVL
ncbi:MAG TPA: copper-translocating P-type ATPase, partial [Anaerolineales bacterium]|nr:copper-translocating P-type ATPase [Anaerolineales bacterium]